MAQFNRNNRNNKREDTRNDEFRGLKLKDDVVHIYDRTAHSTVEKFEAPFIYVRDVEGSLKNKLRPMLREELILSEDLLPDDFGELSSQTW